MRLSIRYKVIIAFLIFSIVPLVVISYLSIKSLKYSGEGIINLAIGNLEREEEITLIKEAENYAKRVSDFLKDREKDLFSLLKTPFTEKSFLNFYNSKKGRVWYAKVKDNRLIEIKEEIPLYKEIAFVNKDGKEEILVKDGRIFNRNELREVKRERNTTYLIEDYFNKTKKLKEGEIYLSHLSGFAMTKKDQIGDKDLDEVKGGKRYDGVLRFSAPLYEDGEFKGIVTLALDHIHLQELSIHILPKLGDSIVFSSYQSGNYAFIFDNRGWIITHPKYWDFPGVFKDGVIKEYMKADSKKEDIESGLLGFNLQHVGFLSEGYPKAYKEVMEGKSGIVTVTNVGGVKKIMAYAPIQYKSANSNIFGGFTLGAELNTFWETANKSKELLSKTQLNLRRNIAFTFFVIIIIVAFISVLFANHLIEPIVLLSRKVEFIGDADFERWKKVERKDEIGDLAKAFYEMNKKIVEQKESLLRSMEEIEKNKRLIEDYNIYLKRQVDTLKNEDLRQKDRLSSIGRLSAYLAHEIRNPLTGITLFLDDLHDSLREDNNSKRLIVEALKEIERLEKLVNTLLDFSSPKSFEKTRVNVNDIIDSIELLVKKLCLKRNINFIKNYESEITVLADKEKIKQAVLNIVLNAIDVLTEGGKIIVSTRKLISEEKEYGVIEIKDTGPGIIEEEIDKIFDPFYSLKEGGTGLGLAISKSIVNEHNGIIFAKNYEEGAIFEIWLPANEINR